MAGLFRGEVGSGTADQAYEQDANEHRLENHRAQLTYDDAVIEQVESRCTEVESAARNVDHILTRTLLPEMAREVLARMASGDAIGRVHVTVSPTGTFEYQVGL